MKDWLRAARADLGYLSGGVAFYPVMYFTGLLLFILMADSRDQLALWFAPAMALLPMLFMHIASERFDGIAERIVVELGSHRARVMTRALSLTALNSLLYLLGLGIVSLKLGHNSTPTPTVALTGWSAVLVFATAGTVIAAVVPHVLVGTGLFLLATFASNPASGRNYVLSELVHISQSPSLETWALNWTAFIGPVLLAAFLAWPPAMSGKTLNPFRRRKRPTQVTSDLMSSKLKFSVTTDTPSTFRISLMAMKIDPWHGLVIFVGLVLFSLNGLAIAKEMAPFSAGETIMPTLCAMVFLNIAPAAIAAQLVFTNETRERDYLMFRSPRAAKIDLSMRSAAAAAIGLTAIGVTMILLGGVTTMSWLSFRSIVTLLALGPSVAVSATLAVRKLKSQFAFVALGYLLSLPEMMVFRFAPSAANYLPSSLFGQLAGGFGPLHQQTQAEVPAWLPWFYAVALIAGCVSWILHQDTRTTARLRPRAGRRS